MIDTHTHIYLEQDFPEGETVQAVSRAVEAGVTRMILPGVDVASIAQIRRLHAACPEHTAIAVGLHPTEVTPHWREHLDIILQGIDDEGVVAIGEVGMDLHEDTTYRAEQLDAFRVQVEAAFRHSLPLIIHQREALEETLQVLREAKERRQLPEGIVFHCFTGTAEDVARIREVVPEAYFGIGGVATFKNARGLREALLTIGLDHIVLETDAHWLAPTPLRGKRNESALLPHIARSVADTLACSLSEVEATTDANAHRLFPRLH